ncbi:MAG: tRNA (adenosine(37)-N6)-threonylcarbamoyltransferase complex dimerization subunit type 1 TsaB [Pirellulales bacterium]|nr:tRNA (adenosine(37)-N6)-threonylcarbamoyltransferase complex dimerization subunit type 1 TsaB [Pirellulales bacterium]
MKILAIETTERVGTVAAAEGTDVLRQLSLDSSRRSAQSLAPAMVQLLDEVGWRPADVDLVAVSIGPGSFTGLRLGVTAAKVFAYAVEADLLGIDTLETIAAGVPADNDRLAVAVDAQRGQIAAAVFARGDDDRLRVERPMELVEPDAWLATLPEGTAVAGPILKKIVDCVPAGLRTVAPEYWSPTAATVARLAARDYQAGRRDDLWQLTPRYSRRSAAEEKHDL